MLIMSALICDTFDFKEKKVIGFQLILRHVKNIHSLT